MATGALAPLAQSAILYVASMIVNASRKADAKATVPMRAGGAVAPLNFAWPSEVYNPSWVCGKRAVAQNSRQADKAASGRNSIEASGEGHEANDASEHEVRQTAVLSGEPRLDIGRNSSVPQEASVSADSGGSGGSTCGYKYTDLAAHPLAVLLPYSVCGSVSGIGP